MTPLRTPEAARKYQLTYLPVGADPADGAAADGAVGETEIIVNAMWLEQTALQVQVVGGGEAAAKVTMARRPGAQLTKDVSYEDSVKVTVVVAEAVVGRAVTITLTSKQ